MDPIQNAIMELQIVHQAYDAERPWSKRYPATRHAQAVVVEGPLLMTTAQMILGATIIEVQREGRPPRAEARVVHADRELNLALLAVDRPGFFDGVTPVPLAEATPTSGVVQTVRWRRQQFEVAATRVQRFEVREVFHGRLQHAFLHGQTDLTGGGWAEPVVQDGKLVGIATNQDDHTAIIMPSEILNAYRAQVLSGEYAGFGVARFGWGANVDPGLAAYLGQKGEQTGIIIWQIPAGSTGHGSLRTRDILLELGGHRIDASGFHHHPRFGRIGFQHIVVEGYRAGDPISARVLRDGEEVELSFPVRAYPTEIDLVPLRRGDDPPPYIIVGGLILLELDGDYLRCWGQEWWEDSPIRLIAPFFLQEGMQSPERRRWIVLSQVLPTSWTIGYQDLHDLLVEKINGREIDSIQDVVDALAHPEGDQHRLSFYPNPARAEMVLDAATLEAQTAQVLEAFDIPAPYRLPARPLPPLE